MDAGVRGGDGGAGAADDDPLCELEELAGVAPLGKGEEGVGTDEVKENVVGVESVELAEGVDRVVGEAVGAGCVDGRGGEAWMVLNGEGDHGETIGKGGGGKCGLEGLEARGCEEDLVEVEGVGSRSGDGEVAKVRGVEGSAEQSDAHVCLWYRSVDGRLSTDLPRFEGMRRNGNQNDKS